jgi:ankyrin repeat protein
MGVLRVPAAESVPVHVSRPLGSNHERHRLKPSICRRFAPTAAMFLSLLPLCACRSPTPREKLAELGVPFSERAFVEQAKDGKTDVVALFLAAGMSPDATDAGGTSALVWAMSNDHRATARALVDAGADLRAPAGNDGMTLLMLAAQQGNGRMVRTLLAAGAEVDARDASGNTALLQACASGSARTVRLLLERGADPDRATRETNATPLGLAAAAGDAEIVATLLVHGGNPNVREARFGMTPLAVAALKGHAAVARALLEAGADPAATNHSGQTPIEIATRAEHPEIVALLKEGAPRRETPAPSGPFTSAALRLPQGWVLAEPFTDRTPFWPGKSRLRTNDDPPGTRRALIRAPREVESQAFLILGNAADWKLSVADQIDELEAHPLVERGAPREVRMRDGTRLSLRSYRMLPGLIGGNDVTYLLGSAEFENRLLVVDAGGATRTFDEGAILAVLASLDARQIARSVAGQGGP